MQLSRVDEMKKVIEDLLDTVFDSARKDEEIDEWHMYIFDVYTLIYTYVCILYILYNKMLLCEKIKSEKNN